MGAADEYFDYLQTRSALGLWYRRYWLYPRLCRHLSRRVLDVGCGIGDMVRFRPGTVGVDVNPRSVESCLRQGLDVRLMAPDQLPFADQSFQGVVLDNVLEHLASPSALLAEIHRVLAPDATLLVGVPGRRGYASDPDHKTFYSEAALIQCITRAGFGCHTVFHAPFRSVLLDATLRIYAVYGVFRRTR